MPVKLFIYLGVSSLPFHKTPMMSHYNSPAGGSLIKLTMQAAILKSWPSSTRTMPLEGLH